MLVTVQKNTDLKKILIKKTVKCVDFFRTDSLPIAVCSFYVALLHQAKMVMKWTCNVSIAKKK